MPQRPHPPHPLQPPDHEHRTTLSASEQLVRHLLIAVQEGTLRPGQRLLPVREEAARSGLAPNTVAKAYRELEGRGVLVARGRLGTFVANREDAHGKAAEAAGAYVRLTRDLGLESRDALDLVAAALKK